MNTKEWMEKINRTKEKINKKAIKDTIVEIIKILFIINMINLMQMIIGKEYILTQTKEIILGEPILWRKILNYSLLIILALYLLIYAISNRKKLSLMLTTIFLFIFESINYFVFQIRGVALSLSDILSIGTALGVANGITIKIDGLYLIGCIVMISTIAIIGVYYKRKTKTKLVNRIIYTIIGISIFIFVSGTQIVANIETWRINVSYEMYGSKLVFVNLVKNYKVNKPEDYNSKEVTKILASYDKAENVKYNDNPNIIVIMNESFTDYLHSDLILNEDNIPYFHKLQKEENAITGIMHSSCFGGNTANVEYEFLTQNSMSFLPVGAVPYQQFINQRTNSIVKKMEDFNYKTYGIHTWGKQGYSRGKVYKELGFDHYAFQEDYDDLQCGENGYPTDESSYSKIIEILENKPKEEKIFSFNVTMQNHMPYNVINENAKTYSNNIIANIYLQRENESDKALEKIVEYLKNYDEKVVLLFFGDHQPNLRISQLNDNEEEKYKVPYLIWANYDIEEKNYGDTSANYLQSMLVEVANLPKDKYTNYISSIREEIPVITTQYYIGNDGIKYNLNDENSPYYSKMQEYNKIVYYQMFDNESSVKN